VSLSRGVAVSGSVKAEQESERLRVPRPILRRTWYSLRSAGGQPTPGTHRGRDQHHSQGFGMRVSVGSGSATHRPGTVSRPAYRCILSRSYGATGGLTRRGHWRRVRPRLRAGRTPQSGGSEHQWAGNNLPLRHFVSRQERGRPDFSEAASDLLLLPVGMTGFEPATP
jgi:hypothetical protein